MKRLYILCIFVRLFIISMKDKIILGIDPGTNIMGYGLIQNKNNSIELLTLGVVKLAKLENQPLKLKKIFETTLEIIERYKPDEFSIEAPFYGKNIQSMLKLGRAQGVAIAAALYRSVPVFEYSPRKIKQSITGNGNASKEQVSAMLCTLLKIKEAPEFYDATDGLAAAVCHHFQNKFSTDDKKYTGWKTFLNDNPDRKI
jgi:crossover junction endodeoxyribonuclease RuvC